MSSKTIRSIFLQECDAISTALSTRAKHCCEICGIRSGSKIPGTKLKTEITTVLKSKDLDPTNAANYICACDNCAPMYFKIRRPVSGKTAPMNMTEQLQLF